MASWSGGRVARVLLLYGWPNICSIVWARAFSQAPHTVLAQDCEPSLFRLGHVVMACWNLNVHVVPVMILSFRRSVTLSTFSMLDTK